MAWGLLDVSYIYMPSSVSSTKSWEPRKEEGRSILCWGSWVNLFSSSPLKAQSKIIRFSFILFLFPLCGSMLTPCSYNHLKQTFMVLTQNQQYTHVRLLVFTESDFIQSYSICLKHIKEEEIAGTCNFSFLKQHKGN